MEKKFKTSEEVTKTFWELEEELDLFNIKIDGVYIWERIRFGLHKQIQEELGLYGQAHTVWKDTLPSRITRLLRFISFSIFKSPVFSSPKEVVFLGSGRRRLLEDNKWWDIFSDFIIDFLEEEYLLLEFPHLGKHLRPAKTSNLKYLDYVALVANLRVKLGLDKVTFLSEELDTLRKVGERFSQEFELEIDLVEIIKERLLRRKSYLPVYRRLLERLSPSIVFLVCSYGKEDLVEACRDLDITTVEFQHGTIDKYHMGYSYPQKNVTKRDFPDYFLAFGDFWKNIEVIPLEDERIISVGYPFLEQELKKYSGIKRKNQILFISQGTIGENLSRFAIKLAEVVDDSVKIVYKLHPGEYERWRDDYPWLLRAQKRGLISVGEEGSDLYKLMAESKSQVGVYSTAIYEGLCFDLKTYLVPFSGIEYMQGLLEKGYAKEVDSVEDLAQDFEKSDSKVSFDSEIFFKSNSLDNFSQFLKYQKENNYRK
jgi:hypothetical protein